LPRSRNPNLFFVDHAIHDPPRVAADDKLAEAGEFTAEGRSAIGESRRCMTFLRTFGTASGPIRRRSSTAASVNVIPDTGYSSSGNAESDCRVCPNAVSTSSSGGAATCVGCRPCQHERQVAQIRCGLFQVSEPIDPDHDGYWTVMPSHYKV
jgi:hypothetical protein